MANRAKLVAFAYDNPTYEDYRATAAPEHAGQAKTAAAAEDTAAATIEIRPSVSATVDDEERDLEQLIYPDSNTTFKRLKWQFWLVQCLIVAHVLLIGYTDPPPENNSLLVQILIISVQIGLIIIIMMAFFVFTSQTIFVRFGRYDKYLREYGLFYSIALVQLLMIAAVKIYYIVLFAQHMAPLEFLSNTIFFSIWVVQRCVLLAFWITAAYQATRVFQHRVYDPDYLLSM